MRNAIITVVKNVLLIPGYIEAAIIGIVIGFKVAFELCDKKQEVYDGKISEPAYQIYCEYKSLYHYTEKKRYKPGSFKRLVHIAYSEAYNKGTRLEY